MFNPTALQYVHESQADDISLDLESLMKAVRAEGAALYAAAVAFQKDQPGGPCTFANAT